MMLSENPFFILGVTPLDNRHRIYALAEEKALLLDSEKCLEAINTLTTPQRRLIAEINWFLGCSSETVDEIIDYISALQSGSQFEEINVCELSALADLNLKRYAFPFLPMGDVYKYKYAILEISRLFEAVDSEQIRLEVNEARSVSGFTLIPGTTEIDTELRNIRSEISHIISQKLTGISADNVAELATMLAEKYTADEQYSGSAVIDDVLSEYALQFNSELQNQKQQICKMVEHIGKSVDDIRMNDAIDDLIKLMTRWDKFAQPLQLDARAKGVSHDDSEELARAVRDLAVDLHNKHAQTEASLKLAIALKNIFAELPDFAERIGEDADTLSRLKTEQVEEEREEKEALRRNRMDIQYSVTLNADRLIVPPFCTCCMKPTTTTENISTSASHQSGNRKTTRTVSMNMPICADCLAHRKKAKNLKWLVVLMAAAIAIGSVPIFNITTGFQSDAFWVLPFAVAAIAYLLLGLIMKLPPLSASHSTMQQSVWLGGIGMSGNIATYTFANWRYAKLFANANHVSMTESKRRNRVKARAYIKAIDHPIGVLFLALVFTGAGLIAFGNSLMAQTSYSSPAVATQKPSTSYTSPATTQSNSSTQTKQQKLDAMEADLNKRKAEIENMEDKLKGLLSDLDHYKSMYNSSKSNTYADLYNNMLDDYNDLYDKYEQAIDEYNDIVADYNAMSN
ncbi:MAG: hypothetical protein VB078_00635 [Clostridiaceae bacterium]|nr:hypothetical protein [Clostridiaceae bacterium]